MIAFRRRFVCIQARNGLWDVIDTTTSHAASLGGQELSGKPQQRAEAACTILNSIDMSRTSRKDLDTRFSPV